MNSKENTADKSDKSAQGIIIMERKASDNKYLHKDFHIGLNHLMNYILDNFGEDSVRDYLRQFARAFYKPLNNKLRSGDLEALESYITDIYEKEEWKIKINKGENYIEIEQESCPGMSHLISRGEKPCPLYRETYTTVYQTLCENTPFDYVLVHFDDNTGACKQLFIRKENKL